MLLGQRHGEGLPLHDAVERELLPLVARLHPDDGAQLLDDVLHDGGGLGVDDPLGAAGEAVDLTLRGAAGGDGGDLLDRGHVLAAAVPEESQGERIRNIIEFTFKAFARPCRFAERCALGTINECHSYWPNRL